MKLRVADRNLIARKEFVCRINGMFRLCKLVYICVKVSAGEMLVRFSSTLKLVDLLINLSSHFMHLSCTIVKLFRFIFSQFDLLTDWLLLLSNCS